MTIECRFISWSRYRLDKISQEWQKAVKGGYFADQLMVLAAFQPPVMKQLC